MSWEREPVESKDIIAGFGLFSVADGVADIEEAAYDVDEGEGAGEGCER